MTKLTVFNRSLAALTFGCALASLPVSVRAQDAPPPDGAMQVQPAPEAKQEANAVKAAGDMKTHEAAGQKLSATDKMIAQKFANINETEIEMGKLALTNAESTEVKDYAQKMVDDHTKANEELVALAKDHGTDLKPEVPKDEHAAYDHLKGMKGGSFDAMYAKHMAAGHAMAAKTYEADEKKIKDKALLAYAEKTLPTVKEHEKMAQALKGAAPMSEEKAAKKKKS